MGFQEQYNQLMEKHADLFKANEILGMQIASIHNLAFYLWLVGQARQHIEAGDFISWKNIMVAKLGQRL